MQLGFLFALILMFLALIIAVLGLGGLVFRKTESNKKKELRSNHLMVLRIIFQASAIILVAIIFMHKN